MNTLKVQVTSYGQPLPGALVRLSGDDAALASHPDAVLAVNDGITWTREIRNYSGNRWNCWQRHVAQDVAGITWQEFREQVLVHNPSLGENGGQFEAGRLYFLPENRLPANIAPLVVWDRALTGFDGNLWECWQQHGRGKVLGLNWRQFSAQFGQLNPGFSEQGRRLHAAGTYWLPRTFGGDTFYLAAYTGQDGSCVWDGLAPGAYRLLVTADKYVPWVQEVVIAGEGETAVEVELEATPLPKAIGYVEVKRDKAGVPRFYLNDQAFQFIGVNLRGLLHYGGDEWKHHDQGFLGASRRENIEQQLQQAQQMGVRVVRVFAACKHVPPEEVGDRLQRVLDHCQRLGLYVIPALTDLYNNTPLHPQGDDEYYTVNSDSHTLINELWFKGEFTKNYLRLMDYLVDRFADHPHIFAWEIGNELKLDEQAEAFTKFVHGVARHIRERDHQHMITAGIISTHHIHMKYRPDLQQQFYQSRDIDFLTVHAYNRHLDSEKVDDKDPRKDHKIHKNDDSQLAGEVGKPFIIEEAGIDADKGSKRDAAIADDMEQWFKRGAQGYMQWGFMATDHDNGDGDRASGMDRGMYHDDWDELFRTYRDKAVVLAADAGNLPPALPLSSPASFKAGQTVFTTATVNLRRTPDASSNDNVLTRVPGGTGVTILGESKTAGGFIWWRVRVSLAGAPEEGWMAQATKNTTLLSLT